TAITLSGDGLHNITASTGDLAGNTGTSPAVGFTLDTANLFVSVALTLDTGISATDGITAMAALSGAGDPNATVTISEGGTTLGQSTVDGAGFWVFKPTGLADGAHTLTASESDAAGNTASATLRFTLKSVALTPFGLALSPAAQGNATTTLS